MTITEQIRKLTDSQKILEFSDFVLSGSNDSNLPDCEKLDLMKIPKLVPNIFIADHREGIEKGILIKFSGTLVDERFGQNIQGKFIEDVYAGHDMKEMVSDLHRASYLDKKPFFAKRVVYYAKGKKEENRRLSTVIFFPCSSNGKDVNYGMGMAVYETAEQNFDPVYRLLEY